MVSLRERWPQLDQICNEASRFDHLEVWLFGSALRSDRPNDIDVLVLYQDRADVRVLRQADVWDECEPPVHLIAMTAAEERHYDFVACTEARRLI